MRIHPITGMRLEDGHGHLPDDQQALVLHCAYIEQTQGKEVADEMRAKLRAAQEQPAEPEQSGGDTLRQDGPTVAEFVAAGYKASNYPPSGYAPKSTPEEIAAEQADEAVRNSAAQLEADRITAERNADIERKKNEQS